LPVAGRDQSTRLFGTVREYSVDARVYSDEERQSDQGLGPPFPAAEFSGPVKKLEDCAVNNAISKLTIFCCSTGIGLVPSPCAWVTVASSD
jgi:hypothetical protein